jgi:ABC-type uncharacterized transport system substrate-binding protein
MAAESIWPGMFQADAGKGKTARVKSTRDAIGDTVASYAISDGEGARKKVLDNRQWTAVNRAGMGKKTVVALLVGLALTSVRFAEAQQPKRVSRIGFLSTASSATQSRTDAFRHGLRDLGYVEGQNIVIEYRYSEGKQDLATEMAAELIRLKVDLIVAPTTPAILAIKKASSTMPIVFASISDPVASGFVASLARPGGNMTG